MSEYCSFCNEFEGYGENNFAWRFFGEGFDRRIGETENFVVLPSFGAFVEGYTLVVPKEHFLSAGEMDDELLGELEHLVGICKDFGEIVYGKKSFVFEHGSCGLSLSEKGGACVLHAHLNIVPAGIDLAEEFKRDFDVKEIGSYKGLREFSERGVPYLFYEGLDGAKYAAEARNVMSQYFRRLAAEKLGLGDRWDWRKYPGKEEVLNALEKFRKLWK